jgi:hypothetical protein
MFDKIHVNIFSPLSKPQKKVILKNDYFRRAYDVNYTTR